MSFHNCFRIVSTVEDVWNFNAEFEIKNNLNYTPNLINAILFESTKMIYNIGIFNKPLILSYYSHYLSEEDLDIDSNIIIEADVIKKTNENLIAECYLYEKFSNKFLAKSFFVYASQF